MLKNKIKTCSNQQKLAITMIVIFFAAMITGFASKSFSLPTDAAGTRMDMMREMARILKNLTPLFKTDFFQNQPLIKHPELKEEFEAIASLGIVKSFPDGSWKLDSKVTRGECAFYFEQLITAISSNMKQEPRIIDANIIYSDVTVGHWLEKPLKKLGGLGALSFCEPEIFNANKFVTTEELRVISSAIIEFLSNNLLLVSFDGETVTTFSKGALKEIPLQGWSFSFDNINWFELPEDGRFKPIFAKKRICQISFRHNQYLNAGPIKLVNNAATVGYIKLKRDYSAVVRELSEKSELKADKNSERERIRLRLEELKKNKLQTQSAEIIICKENPKIETPKLVSNSSKIPEPELKQEPEKTKPTASDKLSAIETKEFCREIPNVQRPIYEAVEKKQPSPAIDSESNGSKCFEARIMNALTGRSISGAIVIIANQQYISDANGKLFYNATFGKTVDLTAYSEGFEALQMKHRPGYRNGPLVLSLKPALTNFSGKVTCRISGKPIAGVLVKIGEKATKTDAEGFFSINGIKDGYQQISCFAESYMETHEIIYIQKSEELVSIELSPLFQSSYFQGEEDSTN